MTLASRITEQLAAIPTVGMKMGTLVARSGSQVLVNLGESTVSLPVSAQQLPPSGHPVVVQTLDGRVAVTGPARSLPGRGVITGLGSPRVSVLAWDVTYTLPVAGSYTPALGDEVTITWDLDGGIVTSSISAPANVVPPPVVQPAGPQQFHPAPFTASDTGSFQSGRWTKDDVWASDSLTGFWFYGSVIADTIPDEASITAAAIYLSPTQSSGSRPNLQLHSSATRPGGQPAFVGAQHQPAGTSGWQPIPLSFIDYLKSNAGGIGVNHGGYHRFRSKGQDGLSGALDITWTA
jgi:hypothetical protein